MLRISGSLYARHILRTIGRPYVLLWMSQLKEVELTRKCLIEYVRTCALFDAMAGYPSLRGHLRGSIFNPWSMARGIIRCSNSGRSMGNPSLRAPLLRPRGCIRLVAKTAVFPVWEKHNTLSNDARSSNRMWHGTYGVVLLQRLRISCLYMDSMRRVMG